jgi:hypothetical protein
MSQSKQVISLGLIETRHLLVLNPIQIDYRYWYVR